MPSSPKPPLILLVGPTAAGKTELAIEIARKINAEIVSADSRLFYRGLDIGTAKPTGAQRALVPHHLIDIAQPDATVTLAVFQSMAAGVIDDIWARDRLPMLVGGTGQYVRAVTEGWSPPGVGPNVPLRQELDRIGVVRGRDWLHRKLASLDPLAAQKIDARNARRTVRALEVILSTGRKFSEQRTRRASPSQLIAIGLTRPRPELYARIDARIESMFENGLIEEVRSLLEAGYAPELPSMSAIGYRQCVKVIKDGMSIEQAKAEMRRETRVFVRRQANWFKESDPAIRWFRARPGIADEIGVFLRNRLVADHN